MKSDHLDVPITAHSIRGPISSLHHQKVRTKRSSSLLMPKTTLRLTESRFLGLRYPSCHPAPRRPHADANLIDGGCLLQAADETHLPLTVEAADTYRSRCQWRQYRRRHTTRPRRSGAHRLIILEDIELEADHDADAAGYQGEVLVTATLDGQTLRVNYHDPIGLNLIAEEQTNVASGAVYDRVHFVESEDRLR